jgi:hypothetical protein
VGPLEVNDELLVAVADDEDADGTGAGGEGFVDLLGKATLFNNLDAGRESTAISHGDKRAVTASDDLVLLEAGGQHAVQDNRGRRVGDDAVLLNQLVGEQVNTEVTVLAGGGRGSDADDLAWALLEDDQVTNADVVARNGEVGADSRDGLGSRRGRSWLGGLGLDRDVDLGQRVSLLGLGVVGPGDVGLGSLNWVEELVDLAAEVLDVVVVAVRVGRHLFGFGFLVFLFLLVDDDNWSGALDLGLDWLASGALSDLYVDVVDVGGARNVNLRWGRNKAANKDALFGGGVGGGVGDLAFDLDLSSSSGAVRVTSVAFDGRSRWSRLSSLTLSLTLRMAGVAVNGSRSLSLG